MADFQRALEKTLRFEGGYVNDPEDRGGETYFGISRKSHPDWRGWMILDEIGPGIGLPLEMAVEDFYRKEFWEPQLCNEIHDGLQEVAEYLFDCRVNHGARGMRPVVKALQKRTNELDVEDVDLVEDGYAGPKTVKGLNRVAVVFDEDGLSGVLYARDELALCMIFARIRLYAKLVSRDHSQAKYIKGWITRATAWAE